MVRKKVDNKAANSTSKRLTADLISGKSGHKSKTAIAGACEANETNPPEVLKREKIALLAYSYWERRGYQGGSPEEDWYRAEREIDQVHREL